MDRPVAAPRNLFNNNDNEEPEEKDTDVEASRRNRRHGRNRRDRDRTDVLENDSDLDAAELNRQIEKLERDLARRERELEEERTENERALDKVKKLERDKLELKREVEDFREESNEYKRNFEELKVKVKRAGIAYGAADTEGNEDDNMSQNHDYPTSAKNYELILQQKNREITQLIEDIEKTDEDKKTLQEKLSELKNSLQEATEQIETMANDHFSFKSKLKTSEEKIKQLEEENTVLVIKQRDLLAFKERHDQYLENLCSAVDVRVDVWKKMMFEKDEEIDRLNVKIAAILAQTNTQADSEKTVVQQLKMKLLEREQQITMLNDKLQQATEEIESSVQLIENLNTKVNVIDEEGQTGKQLRYLQLKLKKCETQLEKRSKQLSAVEKEAEEKSREIIQLLSRMHDYEVGEYGLSEAVSEIKDLKTQIRIRNTQVETVTQEINILQLQVNDLMDENDMLRAKLGKELTMDLQGETKRYCKNRKNEVSALRSKVVQLEEEVVQLKTTNRSLKKQVTHLEQAPPERELVAVGPNRQFSPSIGEFHAEGSGRHMAANIYFNEEDWKERYDTILDENTELRKGMQDILNEMQKLSEESSSDILIQSPILENLLREMSARGLIHYPYPITSFHLKVCNVEGKNSQLREELHRSRQEEKLCRTELAEANAMIHTLEEKLTVAEEKMRDSSTRVRSRSHSPSSRRKKVTFDNGINEMTDVPDHLQKSTTDLPETEETKSIMTEQVRNLIIDALQTESESLRASNQAQKEKFLQEKCILEDQIQLVVQKANNLLEATGDAVNDDGKTLRKIEFLKSVKDLKNTENNFLLKRISEVENENIGRLGFLEGFKVKALHQISAFHQILEGSVPMHLLYATKKQLRELTRTCEELKRREENFAKTQLDFHKKELELSGLKEKDEKLEEEIESLQAKVLVLSVAAEQGQDKVAQPENYSSVQIQKEEFRIRLEHQNKINELLKSQIEELEKSKKELEKNITNLIEKLEQCQLVERELREKTVECVSREEFDSITNKLITLEEKLLLERDEMTKWREIAEMAQNQVKAIENIKDFERMEFDSLLVQVMELQSESNEKAFVAKAQRQVLVAEKEKHLAIQQVQKLLSKLSHLEACTLQADKLNHDREMALISMHTQVIMRYRSLFAALHESNAVRPPSSRTSTDFAETFELLTKAQEKCLDLESQLFEERVKLDEFKQKCCSLEDTLRSITDGNEQDFALNSMQKVQEARIEVARWKRKAEQADSQCANLRESVQRLETRTSDLEEDRIRLEHSLELKDSLTSTLIASSVEKLTPMSVEGLVTVHLPTGANQLSNEKRTHKDTQTEEAKAAAEVKANDENMVEKIGKDREKLEENLKSLAERITELENTLQTKEQIINEFKLVQLPAPHVSGSDYNVRGSADSIGSGPTHPVDVQEALEIAKENIVSLQDRLKTKEDSISQYRKLLAEVRTEMSSTTERHVQEMRALQLTIYQQQHAFTRMKSTLSQPVRDSLNIDGTIKDQLTRIHELEDEVSELQHALGNVASQLTAARSEAHRWRCTSDARLKELDSTRGQISSENADEINNLKKRINSQVKTIEELQAQLAANKSEQSSSLTELVTMLRTELDEKEKQLEIYMKTLQNTRSSSRLTENRQIEERLLLKEKEIEEQKELNKQLQQKIAALQVRISKLKVGTVKTGASSELEVIRHKFRELSDEKMKLEKQLNEYQLKRDEDEEKRRKTTDSVARWEESKKWKRNTEKLEARIKELELENDKLNKTIKNLRTSVTRLEKEKMVLDSRVKARTSNLKSNSASKGSLENVHFTDSSTAPSNTTQKQSALTARFNLEIQDLKEQVEKTEFEGKEEAEKLKMEIHCLKERIVTQERQLTAYQIAQKGDPSIRTEIEKMAAQETKLQKDLLRLEEENLHLKLQMEQLRLDTPRLRDRVQHLQKLVDALKADQPDNGTYTNRANSQKSLGELERTILALKQVIDKLQNENKRLKTRPGSLKSNNSNDRLKTTLDSLMTEKRALIDEVQNLQDEKSKFHKLYLEACSRVEAIGLQLKDTDKRAKSAEMKLKSFLGESGSVKFDNIEQDGQSTIIQKLRLLQDELERKNKLLGEAQVALKHAEASMGKRQNQAK